MPHNSSATRSSSPRYLPSSRSSFPASSRPSPAPLTAPSSGHDAERLPSDDYLSPAPASLSQVPSFQCPYGPAPVTYTRYSAPNHQPVQPSITIHQPDSTYQNHDIHQHQRHTPQPGQAYYGKGMFNRSQNLSFSGNTFIDNSITSESSDNFMKEFLQHTIIGAEFDSSDRHPPPRCHPGTRLAIIERCKNFIDQYYGKEKMRWVVGGAGFGKSAIMQIVAEEIPADASVFFSVNGRNDGTKFFTTIAYQLAVKYEPYRQFIRNAINRDPSLLRKSLPVQFQKFIIDPFIHHHLFNDSQRFLIIIDGLDECDNPLIQGEILGLISDFCLESSASPVVWFVASRPEPHITSFFDDARVAPAYTKEEIVIDSDEACKEVQQYIRDKLNKIKLTSPTLRHKSEWPSRLEFTKFANAAGGLFAYASTVVRYIGNSHYRDPATLLGHVLEVINAGFKDGVSRKNHPMALLDALYRRILSNIPLDVMVNTRKLLLTAIDRRWKRDNLRHTCNRLGLSEAAAYDAVSYLHAVLKVPAPDNADDEYLEYFHKSFPDFLLDFKRSGFSHSAEDGPIQLRIRCSLWIVTQVSDDFMDSTKAELIEYGSSKSPLQAYGYLKAAPGFCDDISLSWPSDERFLHWDDASLRHMLYCDSMVDIIHSLLQDDKFHPSISLFHALTTRFNTPGHDFDFPIYRLRDGAFEQFRAELTELGKLKEVPLRTLDYAAICGTIDVCFTLPIGMCVEFFDFWRPSCTHLKHVEEYVNDLQQRQGWETQFGRSSTGPRSARHPDIPRFGIKVGNSSHFEVLDNRCARKCLYCSRRLAHHFIDYPDQVATVFVDSTGLSYVELSFVDPRDGVSEWRYRFCHSGPPSDIDWSWN